MIETQRYGQWTQTFSGIQFWPLDPRPEEVEIEDIAHALSMICRFNGHCKRFYSVAQHSVLVSYECDPEDALWGLLHDAAEAYLGDLVRPLKMHDVEWAYQFRRCEVALQDIICKRFDLNYNPPQSVLDADERLLATEARDLMGTPPAPWNLTATPLDREIEPLAPWAAKAAFLARFRELYPTPRD